MRIFIVYRKKRPVLLAYFGTQTLFGYGVLVSTTSVVRVSCFIPNACRAPKHTEAAYRSIYGKPVWFIAAYDHFTENQFGFLLKWYGFV